MGGVVTILILVDGFLQLTQILRKAPINECHNPYFSRWFSAIKSYTTLKLKLIKSQSLF